METVAEARSRWQTEKPWRVPIARAETNARGVFSLPFDAQVADLQIDAEGFAPYATRVAKDEDIGACVLRAAVAKSGKVSAGAKPIAGARIIWSGFSGTEVVATTGNDGRYSIPDPESWATRVGVIHAGHAIEWFTRGNGDAKPALDRRLEAGVPINGRIVASDGTSQVVDAAIFVDGWKLATSGEDGEFSVEHAPANWRVLRAVLAGASAVATKRDSPLSLRLEKTPRLSGGVVDARTGRPLQGAEIALVAGEDAPMALALGVLPEASAFSDESGRFTIEYSAGEYGMLASLPGYGFASAQVTLSAGTGADRSIPLARLARVTGRVVDVENHPLAAAVVAPSLDGGRGGPGYGGLVASRAATSGPDGSFVLRAVDPADDVVLEASAIGTAVGTSKSMKLTEGETKSGVVITVPAGIVVNGRVVDPEGVPIADVSVTPVSMSRGTLRYFFMKFLLGEDAREEVVTGSDGRFAVRLTGGEYMMQFSRDGFVTYLTPTITVTPGLEPIEVTLRPGARIAGHVVREGKGPIAGAVVAMPDRSPASGKQTAVTGPDGAFAFDDLQRGTQRVIVTKADEMISIARIVEAPVNDLTIEVPRGESVEGRVIDKDSGAPITSFSAGVSSELGGGALRLLLPPMTKSFQDDDGRFVLEGLPLGPVNVIANAPGYVQKRAEGLTLEEGRPIRDLEIALVRGTTIIGRVTDGDGKPIDEVWIHPLHTLSGAASISSSDELESAVTDASGTFRMESVAPGEKTFQMEREGFLTVTQTLKVSGREVRLDVELSRGASIAGVVVTQGGAPVEDASVMASSSSPGWPNTQTDAEGRFRLSGLPDGRYRVSADRSGYVDAHLDDVDPKTAGSLRLVLKEGGRIRGRVIGLEPWQYAQTYVSAWNGEASAGARLDSGGSFVIEGAPTGTVSVVARKTVETTNVSVESEPKSVELAVGGEASVEIEFREGRTITGRVTRNGAALQLASLRFNPRSPIVQTRGTAITDASGMYEVEGLDDGEYNVIVQPDAAMGSAHGVIRVIGPATTTIDIDLESARVSGRVTDAGSGMPVSGARIAFERKGTQVGGILAQRLAESGEDGSYSIDDVAPDTWIARASKEGFAPQLREVEVGSGGAIGVDFKIAESAGVLVRVIDARSGVPVGAVFRVIDTWGRKAFEGSTEGKGDGALVTLAPGKYILRAWADGYAPASLSLRVPSADVSVALSIGGSLEIERDSTGTSAGRLVDATGADYLENYWSTRSALGLNEGVTRFTNVAPGGYTLVVTDAAGNAKSYPVTIREAVVTRVKVSL